MASDSTGSSKPILYSYWRSSCAWRVRIALELKAIAYEYRAVNLLSPELKDPAFLGLNPAGRVPVFVVDGVPIGESLSIIEFLEEKYPDRPKLLPDDLVQRAKARTIFLHVATNIHPVQNLRILQYLNKEEAGKGKTWAAHWLSVGLAELEEIVKASAGRYCIGDTVTLGDLAIPSILYNARRFGVDLTPYPTLLRVDEALSELSAFTAARPEVQPDAGTNA